MDSTTNLEATSKGLGQELKASANPKNELSQIGVDKTDLAIAKMGQAQDAMTKNMQSLLERDDKLDTMLKKTETMSDLSYSISKKVR